MKNSKILILICLIFLSGFSLKAQEQIQNLNDLLDSSYTSRSTNEDTDEIQKLKEAFFNLHGFMTMNGSEGPMLWEREEKPIEDMFLQSENEAQSLQQLYPGKIYRIRTIQLDWNHQENLMTLIDIIREMPNLENILLKSSEPMPEDLDQELSLFLSSLSENQINEVNLYYYAESPAQ